MKVLVVSHSHISLYGAVTSLKYLISNVNWEIDLVYPKHHKLCPSDQDIQDFFCDSVKNIYRAYLPYQSAVIMNTPNLSRKIKDWLTRLRAFADSFRLRRIIREGAYDYILLNSLIIYRMIRKDARYVLYVREKYNGCKLYRKKLLEKLNNADKIIYIDPALVVPFGTLQPPYRVINNPFDMTGMKNLDLEIVASEFPDIDRNKKVIIIAGAVTADKGVLFAIDTFCRVNRQDLQLVIVGDGEPRFMQKCKNHAAHRSDVLFLGNQKEMQKIYLLTDYLLRADMVFATGRTVYEALFAGCNVIMQYSTKEDLELFQEYERYKEKLSFYRIRDAEELKRIFESLPVEKVKERFFQSNIDQYIADIKEFIK